MIQSYVEMLLRNSVVIVITAYALVGSMNAAFAAGAGNSMGTLATYTCSIDPTTVAKFVSKSGGLYVSSVVASNNSCHAGAGCAWEGLNNSSFQSLSFDVQDSSSNSATNNFRVILVGTNGVSADPTDDILAFLGESDASSVLDLGNGWTRYTINSGAVSSANRSPMPTNIRQIIFHQYPSSSPIVSSILFGNVTLNGDSHPLQSTTGTSCPPVTGDDLSCP